MHTKVLVDGSNMWYASYVATPLDKPGGPVMIMTWKLRKVCNHYGRDNVIVCWDAGRSGRKELDSEYKSKRNAVEGVWEDLPYMKKMLKSLGVSTAYKSGFEADDIIGSLANKSDNPILIHSMDKDFYQLVTERIRILRPKRTIRGKEIPEKIIGETEVFEEFKCEPRKVILLKAFKGDSSDNIPKINIRFTPKFKEQLYKILERSSDIESFYQNIDSIESKYIDELLGFKERASINEKLVTIITDLEVDIDRPKIEPEDFEKLCNELEITRLKISDWISMPKEPAPPPPIQRGLF